MILVDTNILLRLLNPDHLQYQFAKEALKTLKVRGENVCRAPQNIIEFWAVPTRLRSENGLGMPPERVWAEVRILRRLFALLQILPKPWIYGRHGLRQ